MAQSKLDVIIDAQWKGARDAKRAATDLDELDNSAKGANDAFAGFAGQAAIVGGALIAFGAAASAAFEALQEGAAIQATERTFANLAGSIGETSDALTNKLRKAVNGTVSDFQLMQSANQLISMGLASSGDEAAELTEIATKLGSAFGKDAATSVEEFGLLLANQSVERLDAFGLSSGKVRARVAELTEGVDGLTREQAFLQAVLEESEVSMERLGDTSDSTATDIARVTTAYENFRAELKKGAAEEAGPVINRLAQAFDALTRGMQLEDEVRENRLNNLREELGITEELLNTIDPWAQELIQVVEVTEELTEAEEEAEVATRSLLNAFANSAGPIDDLILAQQTAANAGNEWVKTADGWVKKADFAAGEIKAINDGIIESYKEVAFEALLAQIDPSDGEQLRGVLQFGVDTGLLTQEQAEARAQYTLTSEAARALGESVDFAALGSVDRVEALDAVINGWVNLEEGADEAAAAAVLLADTYALGIPESMLLSEQASDNLKGRLLELEGGQGGAQASAKELSDGYFMTIIPALDNAAQRAVNLKSKLGELNGTTATVFVNMVETGRDFNVNGQTVRARAHGGSFSPGRPIMVGENGPELLMPSTGGTIVPNNQVNNMQPTINITVAGGMASSPQQLAQTVARELGEMIRR